jgi:carboxypeptidase C (cathepsin A)
MKNLKNQFKLSIYLILVLIILAIIISPDKLFSAKIKIPGSKKSSEKAVDEVQKQRQAQKELNDLRWERKKQEIRDSAQFSYHCNRLNLDYSGDAACKGNCYGIGDNNPAVYACEGNCNYLELPFYETCKGNCNPLVDYTAYNACKTCGGGHSWTSLYLLGHIISCN